MKKFTTPEGREPRIWQAVQVLDLQSVATHFAPLDGAFGGRLALDAEHLEAVNEAQGPRQAGEASHDEEA